MADLPKMEQNEKSGKLKNFFLLGVIPTLFAVLVLLVVLTFSGINIFDKAGELGRKIPVIGDKLVRDEEESRKQLEKELAELRGQLKDREMEIQRLKNALSEKDEEIESVLLEKERLEKQIDERLDEQEEGKADFREIVRTYENMSAKRAAPIISNMSDMEAIKILSHLRPEKRAAILEKMAPEQAAKYTEMFLTAEEGN